MKLSSWLDLLKNGRSRRPFRRSKHRSSLRKSATGKLSFEDLEARTVPAFLAPVDYAIGQYPNDVVIADFNGDSVADLATSNWDTNHISVLLGNPNGTFQPAVQTTVGNSTYSLAVGDFNEDGDLDLVTVTSSSGLSVYLGNGNGTFQTPSDIPLGYYTSSVAVGDLNEDGNLDLVATTNNWVIDYWGYYGYFGHYEGNANVLIGNGSGSFALSSSTPLGYGYHGGAAVADFNGDGNDDLAAGDGSSLVKVALANPDGSLQAPDSYGTDWYPSSVTVGDVNGDSINDLVTSGNSSVSVLLGNGAGGVGDGTFQAARNTATGYAASSVATGDFNDDGRLDLAVSVNRWVIDYWGYYGYYGHYERDSQVLLGYGNGHFVDPQTTQLGAGWLSGVVAADFNGDGFDDLAMPNYYGSAVSVLINDEIWAPLPPPPVSINDVTITEGNSGSANASFTISLPFALSQAVTVHYETANGTATAGSDFTAASGNVIIPAGSTSVAVPIAVTGDRSPEWDETFMVNISSSDASVADAQGVGTIFDDEPRVYINDVWTTEGNTGSSSAEFTVTLSRDYDQPVTIHYATANGSATAGSDFTGVSDATVTVPAGETSATFSIAVLGDRTAEDTESYAVNLTSAANAMIVDGAGDGFIADNEPRIAINDVTRVEGNSKGKHVSTTLYLFRVTLSQTYDQDVTVNFATADGTATVADNDYFATSGTLTIPAGQTTGTITVTVRGDKRRESDEWFALNLTNASTNAFLLDNQGIGWILDDDTHGRG